MNTQTEKPIPKLMHTVTPHIICAGVTDAIEFYKKAFNAVEMLRLPGPDGKLIHACLQIGDSAVMLADEMRAWSSFGPKTLKGTSVTIHLQVDDVDAAFEQAVSAGATVKMPVADMFWGDRYGLLEDPFGHQWSIATHICDVRLEELQAAALKGCG